jgi:hypothetical protein
MYINRNTVKLVITRTSLGPTFVFRISTSLTNTVHPTLGHYLNTCTCIGFCFIQDSWGHCDRMVVRLMQSVPTTTRVESLNPAHGEVYSIKHYEIKFVSVLRQVDGFLLVIRFSTNKTDCHYITEILLKVALNTITPNNPSGFVLDKFHCTLYNLHVNQLHYNKRQNILLQKF